MVTVEIFLKTHLRRGTKERDNVRGRWSKGKHTVFLKRKSTKCLTNQRHTVPKLDGIQRN